MIGMTHCIQTLRDEIEAHDAEAAQVQEQLRQNANLAVQSPWQPMDTAPKDGTIILAFDEFPSATPPYDEYIVVEVSWDADDDCWRMTTAWGDETNQIDPKYWMPRPPRPQPRG